MCAHGPILATEAALFCVPLNWLHTTLFTIGIPAGDLDIETRTRLIETLRQCLAEQDAFPLPAVPALATASPVVLDCFPDERWLRLRAAAADAVTAVLGENGAGFAVDDRPHITLACGVGTADAGAVQSRLRLAIGARVELLLDQLCLVEVA